MYVRLTIDDLEAVWVVPAIVTADELETNLRLLKQYIDDPPSFEDGKSGADLLRRKVVRKDYSDSDGSSSDSSDSESSGKRRKPSKKRERRDLDDAELEARREKRRLADLEKRATIKSSVRIIDSDDDEYADAEFFERERELRDRMARKALEGELPSNGTRKAVTKKIPTRKRREALDMEIEKEASVDGEIVITAIEEVGSPGSTEEVEDDKSEDGDIDGIRPAKKRKIRRAVSISSDEE